MGDFYKINEHDFTDYDTEYDNKVTVVKADDSVDCWWGLGKIIVTLEDIEELKQGKFWYFNDGEYATVIGLKRGRKMTREEAIRILDDVIPPPEHHMVDLDHLRIAQAWLCIKETLTAEPTKHGHWIDTRGGQECSVCGEIQYGYDSYRNYCACCGAKMDGKDIDVPDKNVGKWIDVNGDGSLWRCSACGETQCCKSNYCGDCGANMDEVENG